MNTTLYKNKKIGIWGFGKVGQSAYHLFSTCTPHLTILNKTPRNSPENAPQASWIIQTQDTITPFLEDNDYVIISPGIPFHLYQMYAHKCLAELDLFMQQSPAQKTICITGTLGKTTVTHTINALLQKYCTSMALGNIGTPLLENIDKPLDVAVIEASSFQLQQTKSCAPDIAILTNFYPNHLDHHKDEKEYFTAKCNIFRHQTQTQYALVPHNVIPQVQQVSNTQAKIIALSDQPEPTWKGTLYFTQHNKLYKQENNTTKLLVDLNHLVHITFPENWCAIFAALDLCTISLQTAAQYATTIHLPQHRISPIAHVNNATFYNDSKATVWQATHKAISGMPPQHTHLFLGGLSKNICRTPLFEKLQDHNITIHAFGKEADDIYKQCKLNNITCHKASTLEVAFQQCIQALNQPSNVLFSPGGSSFDLFANFEERGKIFTKLVYAYEQTCAKKQTKQKSTL